MIDASDASQPDVFGHSAFAENADILRAMGNTFLAKPDAGAADCCQRVRWTTLQSQGQSIISSDPHGTKPLFLLGADSAGYLKT
ncbi:hypothetical protein [Agrobacterium pusense]|uniref:hypothetical protein n=1 Tax=Agrobacterium pusense TaxID=648995 RepID=UPI00156BADB9|nr:hypothetical protein [Agrobacterium pusense]QKJ94689.1 hypothetical protein HQN82_25235 [Agrobacterium pusense]